MRRIVRSFFQGAFFSGGVSATCWGGRAGIGRGKSYGWLGSFTKWVFCWFSLSFSFGRERERERERGKPERFECE
jgi:hypothetical protein